MTREIVQDLFKNAKSKLILFVMDGLGGIPGELDGTTELESAMTPNMDALAAASICGLHQPVAPGVTPGSGPSHLSLFGYDPVTYQVGRGVLSALGIDFPLQPGDVAARGNFCTIDEDGNVSDRRAGRISSERNEELCARLREISIPGVEIFVTTVKEYRFLLVLRGENLSDKVRDTDPQAIGKPPLRPEALTGEGQETAQKVEQFVEKTRSVLADQHPANMVLLRGFSKKPDWPTFPQRYGLHAAAIAGYPMYRGVSKLVGMEVLDTGSTLQEELSVLETHWNDFDFFYLHFKKTDSAGEDGDFARKVQLIEEVDEHFPRLLDLNPDVLVVTGDHSTPSILKAHSWHPVPVMLWSRYCRSDNVMAFGERDCMAGGLGPRFPATDILPLMLANGLRLEKFGA
ncbi:MAG: 2,3-bisphosphoglycerate-independent phosphoglycerate mutase [Desulfovibrionales bacterium]